MEPGYIAQSYVYGDSDPRMEALRLWKEAQHPDKLKELESNFNDEWFKTHFDDEEWNDDDFDEWLFNYWKGLGNE